MQDLFTSFKDNCGFGLLASIDNTPTHKNLEDAVTSLSRMMHRGAIAADGKTGDGSGLLLSMPRSFFEKEAVKDGVDLPDMYAVAMVFSNNETVTFTKGAIYCTMYRESCWADIDAIKPINEFMKTSNKVNN